MLAIPAVPPPDVPTVAEIVVTGTALPLPGGARAYSIATIDAGRLETTASGRIEDALKDVAGLTAFRRSDSRSANPTSQGVTLRSLGGNAASRALVLLDGVPIADPFAGYLPWSALDPGRLGSVSVVRGGGTGAFGAGSVAGTILLTSAAPGQSPPYQLSLAGGSRDSWAGTASVSAKLGEGYVQAGGRFDQGAGYVLVPPDQAGRVDIPARYQSWGAILRLLVPVAADTELQVAALVFNDDRVRGLKFANSQTMGADASARLVHQGDWGVDALVYVQTRSFSAQFASVGPNRATETLTLDQYSTPASGAGGKIEVRPPVGEAHDLQLGVDVRTGAGVTNERFRYVAGSPTRLREAGGRVTTVGFFAEDSWQLSDALTLTAGVRADRWEISAGRLIETDTATGAPTLAILTPARGGWEPTARAGFVATVLPVLDLRGALYTGFRVPTPNELYRPFRAGSDATAANPFLQLEQSRGGEAGFDWTPLPSVQLSVTGFANRLDGAIANVTLGTGPGTFPGVGFVQAGGSYRQRLNLQSITSCGVEGDLTISIGAWSLNGTMAYADATVEGEGLSIDLDGLRPAQSPPFMASGTLGWTQGRVQASATLRYVSAQFDDDQNKRRIPPATTLDLFAQYRLFGGLYAEFRAENVTNTMVVSGLSGDGLIDMAQPQTFWFGLKWLG